MLGHASRRFCEGGRAPRASGRAIGYKSALAHADTLRAFPLDLQSNYCQFVEELTLTGAS